MSLRFTAQGQRIFLRGEDVSEAIREPRASMAASSVSAMPEVRRFLLERFIAGSFPSRDPPPPGWSPPG